MTLAHDTGTHPKVAARPWDALTALSDDPGSGWSHYGAWEAWLDRRAEGLFPDSGPILDVLEYDQKIAIYCLMCELADGEGKPAPEREEG